MSYLRFNHVFFALMGLSALSALVIPSRYATKFQPQIQSLFAPVSRPVWSVAAWVSNRVTPPAANDPRSAQDIRQENQRLRAQLARLQAQVDELSRRDAALSELGQKRELCRIAKVVGADAGTRDSLAIAGSSFDGLREEQYVLSPVGLVGQIQRAGAAGAQVRLLTDRAFHIRVRFRRFFPGSNPPRYVDVATPLVLAEGTGNGTMVVRGLALSAIGLDADLRPQPGNDGALLKAGDVAVVADGECPSALQGEPIGRVTRILHRRDHLLFAEIVIQPEADVRRLTEVMVMTKEQ